MSDFFTNMVSCLDNEFASVVDDGVPSSDIRGYIDTGCYILNAQLSGTIYGGMPSNKALGLAGDSSCGKTFIALSIVSNFLKNNPTGGVLYFESESAVSKSMITDRGMDAKRIAIIPVSTIQEFRTQALRALDNYEKTKEKDRPPLMIVLDSLGQLSTTKEIEDSASGKDTRDMTKAQLIKGVFRVLDLRMGRLNIPMIICNHVYSVIGSYFPSKEMSGGTGTKYACDQLLFISKSKDKEGTDVVGNILKFKLDKSRLTKEQSVVEARLSFESGLDRYYGLLDIGVKYGILFKVGNKYKFNDDVSAFEKHIIKNPEKFFTKDILDKLDGACKKEFCYGTSSTEVDDEHIDDTNKGE